MASKSGKEKLIDEEQEVLQAVVLADSWNRRFRPLTTKKPRCLLPICNAPLLDWTFESLALAGVQEVFVVCRSYSELIIQAINSSKWSKPNSGMKISPILTAKETYSAGDAMRDIYTRGLVTSEDFILVHGDLVSNVRIDEVVRVHKERRRKNKDAIMTVVVKEAGVGHRTRSRGDSPIFVVDSDTSECLHYEPAFAYPKKKLAHIPREVLNEHKQVEVRYDLIDCGIDVCSSEVPSLFQDNFDYLDIRRDFVHGVLTSDLLMKNIHIYVEKDGYAARVQDTKSYESVRFTFLSRWTFPLVPTTTTQAANATSTPPARNTSPNRPPPLGTISRSAQISRHTLIGASTSIGDNSRIVASVIGANCVIGSGVVIEDSYVFEGTTVESGCTVRRSIVGSGVVVREGSEVKEGVFGGDGVVVGPGARLREFERLSVPWTRGEGEGSDEDEDSDVEDMETSQGEVDKSTLGADSNAIVWLDKPPEDDDLESPENFLNRRYMRLGASLNVTTMTMPRTPSPSPPKRTTPDSDYDSHTDASVSGRSDLGASLSSGLMADKEFRSEVRQSLERAFAEDHSVDNAAVELKTLRMASNVPLSRVREGVVSAIVEKIPVVEEAAKQRVGRSRRTIGRWGELINRIGGVDAVETVTLLQRMKENYRKTWIVGAQMIHQLDQQSSSEEESEEDDDGDDDKPAGAVSRSAEASDGDDEDDEDD
ncbi:nucleotide-diphospho-sugar transferase [Coprinellus micaceus]|uniref:Translation initiation factor eIF2B subunit epsilon n=1 Tax=Coprinellus micaceus TaxID=71717 RepID=A0A4Y7TBE8_COPMI|nr:nucleotide-diphospho-sugar transferase [Coprinellus micaceus]